MMPVCDHSDLCGYSGFQEMLPAPFEYHRPETLEEVLQLLAEFGEDAKVLAGGQQARSC